MPPIPGRTSNTAPTFSPSSGCWRCPRRGRRASRPIFSEAARLALSLAVRTRDLRLAAFHGHAALGLGDLDAYADAVTYASDCIVRHWDALWPALDEDGDESERWNAVGNLCDGAEMRRLFRALPLADPEDGPVLSLDDIERIGDREPGELPARLAGLTPVDVAAAFRATGHRCLRRRAATLDELCERLAWLEDRARVRASIFGSEALRTARAARKCLRRALADRPGD